jgi:hypothetical protein
MAESSRKPCYFTCVLSEALEYNQTLPTTKIRETKQGLMYEHQEFGTVSEFVDFLGDAHGTKVAVGCVTPKKTSTTESNTYIDEILSASTSSV